MMRGNASILVNLDEGYVVEFVQDHASRRT